MFAIAGTASERVDWVFIEVALAFIKKQIKEDDTYFYL